MSTLEENCTDFLPERNWVFGTKTLDCIDGQSLYDNVVFDTGLVQLIAVAAASVLVNISLFVTTIRKEVHPKFRLLPSRRLCITIHIFAGVVEYCAGLIAWFIPGEYTSYASQTMAIASMVHCLSTLYQIPIVFGLHIVMVPGYLYVVACKAIAAVNLFMFPSCYIRVLVLFNIMSNYAWTRVFITMFIYFSIFERCQYATALLIASAITLPSLGPGMVLYAVLAIALYVRFLSCIYRNAEDKYALCFYETSGNPFDNKSLENIFLAALEVDEETKQAQEGSADETEKKNVLEDRLIRRLFEGMDSNNDGSITPEDAKHYALKMKEPKVYHKLQDAFKARIKAGQNTNIDFLTFAGLFQQQGLLMYSKAVPRLRERIGIASKTKNYEFQARIIFDVIDRNSEDKITLSELGVVLIEFGLPPSEVRYLFLRYDRDNSGFIDFDEFTRYFRPLWRYAFREFVSKMETWDRKKARIERLQKLEDEIFNNEQDQFQSYRKSIRQSQKLERREGQENLQLSGTNMKTSSESLEERL